MKCYYHKNNEAVGICKACNKGICDACAHDTGNGLACVNSCIKEVEAVNEIIDRSKKVYGVGTSGKSLPSGVLTYFLFALLFVGWGVYSSFSRSEADLFPIVMGLGLFIIGVIVYFKQRKLKLNC